MRGRSEPGLAFVGAVVIVLAFAAPPVGADLAQPAGELPLPQDGLGRPVVDPAGNRITYETAPPPRRPSKSSHRRPAPSASPEGSEGRKFSLDWYWATFGIGIGAGGLAVGDIDADGAVELVASATAFGVDGSYWYVVEAAGEGYRQKWTSLPYSEWIEHLKLHPLDDDPALEVVLVMGNRLVAYDGVSHQVERDIEMNLSGVQGLGLGQLDGDAAIEAAVCDAYSTRVYDLDSGVEEGNFGGYGCGDLAVGELDGTPGSEIVVAAGESGWVLDAVTGNLEWDHALGFGDDVELADFDGDGRDEVVAGFAWSGIQVWRGDTHGFLWEQVVFNLATLIGADVDGDGQPELVYGDAQWGSVTALEGMTGEPVGSVANPEHGVTAIAVGDVEAGGVPELFFGAGFTSSGADHLYAVDTGTWSIEWQSADLVGPFLSLAHGDLDANGDEELLFSSFRSESGYGDGLYFVHDALTFEAEFASPEPTGSNWTGLTQVQVADADGDPALEIFLGTSSTYDGILQCRDGATHELEWSQTYPSGLSVAGLRVVQLGAGGAALDVFTGTTVQHTGAPGLRVYTHGAETGTPVWHSPNLMSFFGYASLQLLRAADIDDDSRVELLFAAEGGGVMAFDPVAGTIDLAVDEEAVTALETVDLDGDGKAEVIVGTESGWIRQLDPDTGNATDLAGPFGGPVYGLTIVSLTGSASKDFVFASAGILQIVDGESLEVDWSVDLHSPDTGRWDGLRVGEMDGQPDVEIWVGLGGVGHMLFSVKVDLFSDGFETGDASRWSAAEPLSCPRCQPSVK